MKRHKKPDVYASLPRYFMMLRKSPERIQRLLFWLVVLAATTQILTLVNVTIQLFV